MAHRALFTALILLLGLPQITWGQVAGPEPGAIQGRVLGERRSGANPLGNAVVSLQSPTRFFTVSADSLGRYRVDEMEPGPWRVKATYVGFRATTAIVRVPDGGTVDLDLSLRWEPIPKNPT